MESFGQHSSNPQYESFLDTSFQHNAVQRTERRPRYNNTYDNRMVPFRPRTRRRRVSRYNNNQSQATSFQSFSDEQKICLLNVSKIIAMEYETQRDDEHKCTFSLREIVNFYPLIYDQNISMKFALIQKVFTETNLFGALGRGKFVVLSKGVDFLDKVTKTVTVDERTLLSDVMGIDHEQRNTKRKRKKKLKKRIKREEKSNESNDSDIEILPPPEQKEFEVTEFGPNDWSKLYQYNQDIYQQRNALVTQRIEDKLCNEWEALLELIPPDGNCLVKALNIDRDALCDYMGSEMEFEVESLQFDMDYYRTNHRLLEEPHIVSWHMKQRVNIFVFQYISIIEDKFRITAYVNKDFEDTEIVAFKEHRPNKGHYDRISMGEYGFNKLYEMMPVQNDDDGFAVFFDDTCDPSEIQHILEFDVKHVHAIIVKNSVELEQEYISTLKRLCL
eukprot:186606_1